MVEKLSKIEYEKDKVSTNIKINNKLANSQGYGAPVPMYSGIPLPEMVLHGTNLMFRNVCYYTNRGTRKLLRWNHKKTPIKQY